MYRIMYYEVFRVFVESLRDLGLQESWSWLGWWVQSRMGALAQR